MITYWFFALVLGILDAILYPISFLPDASLPSSLTDGLAAAGNYISIAGHLVPFTITAVFGALVLMGIVENGDAIFKVVKWVYTKIPGIN